MKIYNKFDYFNFDTRDGIIFFSHKNLRFLVGKAIITNVRPSLCLIRLGQNVFSAG